MTHTPAMQLLDLRGDRASFIVHLEGSRFVEMNAIRNDMEPIDTFANELLRRYNTAPEILAALEVLLASASYSLPFQLSRPMRQAIRRAKGTP